MIAKQVAMRSVRKSDFGDLVRYITEDEGNAERVGYVAVTNCASDNPIDAACACDVCRRHSRGYVRHLFQVNEPTASRLVSLHNVAWTLSLMSRMRDSITDGRFAAFRRDELEVWG